MKTENLNKNGGTFLTEHIALQLDSRLTWMNIHPQIILIEGEEIEYCKKLLKTRFPEAKVLSALDPLPIEHSVDLIFSNLTLAFSETLHPILHRWKNILRPEGLCIFSSMGPDTLIELQEQHLQDMLFCLRDMHDVGDAFIQAQFKDPVLDIDHLNITYRNITTLIQELKQIRMLDIKTSSLNLKPNLKAFYSISMEIIFGHAWAPSLKSTQFFDQEVVKIPLSTLRRHT